MTQDISSLPAKFGPVALEDGVSTGHARTYIFAAFWTIGFISFISFMQNYVLAEHLGLNNNKIGRTVGGLLFVGEIAILTTAPLFGALSDRIGRKMVFTLGFVWIGAGFFLFPLAKSYSILLLCRAFMSMGAAALGSMMAATLADYPKNKSRGLFTAMSGAANGLGALVVIVGMSQVPALLVKSGLTDAKAGTYTFWIVGCLALLTAFIVSLGLKSGPPRTARIHKNIRTSIKDGAAAARGNPRLRLAFLNSFIARGDVLLIGTFLSVWLLQAGINQHGLTTPEAHSQASRLTGVVHGMSLIWAPIFGIILDKFDRVSAVMLAMAIAVVAYIAMGLTSDPTGHGAYPALILLGIGEFSVIMSGQTLVAQEAPRNMRGAVMGLFILCGAIGILTLSLLGGYLYDTYGPGSPFLLVAGVNGLILLYAVYVRVKTGYKSPQAKA